MRKTIFTLPTPITSAITGPAKNRTKQPDGICTDERQKQAVVLDSMVRPNGIVGTPDGKQLYVSDIGDSKIYRYTIKPNGLLVDRQLFIANASADGITLDEQGNLYLAGKGITIYNPKGEK
jgi:gluconolactonase